MKKTILLFFALACWTTALTAQEINCRVNIVTPKLQKTDPKIFENLKTTIETFMNNQKWTDDVFETEERITVTMTMTLKTEISATAFTADMAIQATRPVYGSNYESPLISHLDKDFTFTYEQFQPIQYTKNTYIDNLTSMLSFYAYVILGLDYDSFSPLGGESYFQTAQEIYNLLPKEVRDGDGWTADKIGARNRFWIIENILSPRCRPYRQAMYDYHRQGLDLMASDVQKGKTSMMKALEALDRVYQSYPNAMILQMFSNAKAQELIEIFKEGSSQQKNQLIDIMGRLDPANSGRYRDIGL